VGDGGRSESTGAAVGERRLRCGSEAGLESARSKPDGRPGCGPPFSSHPPGRHPPRRFQAHRSHPSVGPTPQRCLRYRGGGVCTGVCTGRPPAVPPDTPGRVGVRDSFDANTRKPHMALGFAAVPVCSGLRPIQDSNGSPPESGNLMYAGSGFAPSREAPPSGSSGVFSGSKRASATDAEGHER